MKFGEWVNYRPETSWLNFGSDSEHVLDIMDIISLHKAKFHYASWFESESVMEFGLYQSAIHDDSRCCKITNEAATFTSVF